MISPHAQALMELEALVSVGVRETPVGGRTRHNATNHGATVHGRAENRHERRIQERRPVRKPLLAIPVMPDGSPAWDARVRGTTVDFSAGGVGFEIDQGQDFLTTAVVLLVSEPDGRQRCAGLEILHAHPHSTNRTKIGGRFGGFAEQLLRAENLLPSFRTDTMDFRLGQPEPILRQWADIGILQAKVVDRVQMCPKCGCLPHFRHGCRQCGSVRLVNDLLLHHYACAYIGLQSEFETPTGLRCPKCRTRDLVAGADFEHLTGPFRCLDCQWTDSELEHVAQCLRCQFRFPGAQANEVELHGYDVNRLDALAV